MLFNLQSICAQHAQKTNSLNDCPVLAKKVRKDVFDPAYVDLSLGFKGGGTIYGFTLQYVMPFTRDKNKPVRFGIFGGGNSTYAGAGATGIEIRKAINPNTGVMSWYEGSITKFSLYFGGVVFVQKLQVGLGASYWYLSDNLHIAENGWNPRIYAKYSNILLCSFDNHSYVGYLVPIALKKINVGMYANGNGIGPAVTLKQKIADQIIIFATVAKYQTVGVSLTTSF